MSVQQQPQQQQRDRRSSSRRGGAAAVGSNTIWSRLLVVVLSSTTILLLLLLPTTVTAKRVSGDFKLSGVNSEKVLTSFAVRPEFGAKFSLQLKAADMYETERFLKLRLFKDEQWTNHLKVMTCSEKIRHATQSFDIVFDYVDKEWKLKEPINDVILTASQKAKYDPRKVMKSKRNFEQQKKARAEQDQGDEDGSVDDAFASADERDLIGRTQVFTAERPQYWYLTMDDCMLEQNNLDSKVPVLHYELEIVNALEPIERLDYTFDKMTPLELQKRGRRRNFRVTHLSADETSLVQLHTFTFIISGGVSALLLFSAGMQSTKQGGSTVHAAVLWVALAAALDSASSFCEIIHLKAYDKNGYGNYFLDALAAHLEALCDAFLILLLLSIGAGWTLPSDAIRVRPNENALQQAFTDLASPLRALLQPTSIVGIFAWSVIGAHAILCQWGRIYNDDFESYHDFAHLPGKLLMMMRIGLGFLLLAVTMRTHLQAKVKQLQDFYLKLAVVGFVWFQSLPFITWAVNLFVPFYKQHPTVFLWSAILQMSSIVLLAVLVTSHSKSSAFAQYSHATASAAGGSSGAGGSSLGESLSQMGGKGGGGGNTIASSFMLGKTKIAID